MNSWIATTDGDSFWGYVLSGIIYSPLNLLPSTFRPFRPLNVHSGRSVCKLRIYKIVGFFKETYQNLSLLDTNGLKFCVVCKFYKFCYSNSICFNGITFCRYHHVLISWFVSRDDIAILHIEPHFCTTFAYFLANFPTNNVGGGRYIAYQIFSEFSSYHANVWLYNHKVRDSSSSDETILRSLWKMLYHRSKGQHLTLPL